MVTNYLPADKCPCCGRSTAEPWKDKSLAEMDRADLLDLIERLQSQFYQVSNNFLRLADLNQRILDRELMRNSPITSETVVPISLVSEADGHEK